MQRPGRLRRDDREFVVLDVVRPERNVLTGPTGLAHAIHSTHCRLGLTEPHLADVKAACRTNSRRLRELLREIQDAAARDAVDNPLLRLVIPDAETIATRTDKWDPDTETSREHRAAKALADWNSCR